MTQQTIGLGTVADDGTGDPLRTAFDKANDNFDELYLRHIERLHPGYVSGLYYAPLNLTGANAAVVADTHYAHPVHIFKEVTISSLAFRVATGAAGNAKLALYAHDYSTGRPGARIATTNTQPSTAATADLTSAFASNQALVPGLYWFSGVFSATPTVRTISVSGVTSVSCLLGASSVNIAIGATTAINGVTGVGTYAGGPPDPFGAATLVSGSVPCICFVVA